MKLKAPLSLLTGIAAVAGGWLSFAVLTSRASASLLEPVVHAPYDSKLIDRQIASGERATGIDPKGALEWSLLASAYLARSRESDDTAAAQAAERATRSSLSLRREGNQGAWNKLVGSLLQQHRFKDALAECEAAIRARVSDDQTFRNHADCLIEVGRYDDANRAISLHARAFSDASGWAIQARIEDIQGHPEKALSLLQKAVDQADGSFGMPSDAVAWFHVRLAALMAKNGRHLSAEKEYKRALELYPRDYKAMAGLARLAFNDQRWDEAIRWCNRSDAIAPMADVRALVGDAYAMRGDRDRAEAAYSRVAALIGRPSGGTSGLHEVAPQAGAHGHRLDRQYAMFCADHRRDPEGAYAAAIRDFDARQDIYAFDTLAWVCANCGRMVEAKRAIEKAMATGTQDPMVLYHGAVIAQGSGDAQKAIDLFRKALAIDPAFDGVWADRARAALATGEKR